MRSWYPAETKRCWTQALIAGSDWTKSYIFGVTNFSRSNVLLTCGCNRFSLLSSVHFSPVWLICLIWALWMNEWYTRNCINPSKCHPTKNYLSYLVEKKNIKFWMMMNGCVHVRKMWCLKDSSRHLNWSLCCAHFHSRPIIINRGKKGERNSNQKKKYWNGSDRVMSAILQTVCIFVQVPL